MKGNELEDVEVEVWAARILQEAQALVDLLGEAEGPRHLVKDNPKVGALVDQWTQPPLFGVANEDKKRPTENITLDERRMELRAEIQSLEPRLKQAFILISGMRQGVERKHDRWKGVE